MVVARERRVLRESVTRERLAFHPFNPPSLSSPFDSAGAGRPAAAQRVAEEGGGGEGERLSDREGEEQQPADDLGASEAVEHEPDQDEIQNPESESGYEVGPRAAAAPGQAEQKPEGHGRKGNGKDVRQVAALDRRIHRDEKVAGGEDDAERHGR